MFSTSTGAFGRWERAAWPLVRPFVPRQRRWFLEGHPALDGQLWAADRELLYETVRAARPAHCFEIGTWKGGGSTLFIAQALCDNGQGTLHTIDVDATLVAHAEAAYKRHLPRLLPYVDFHLGDYRDEYVRLLETAGRVDLLFLDGAEDGRQTLAQYQFFIPWMKDGSVLIAHDWLTEKAALVRQVLETSGDWRIDRVLLPPASVGCARAMRCAPGSAPLGVSTPPSFVRKSGESN